MDAGRILTKSISIILLLSFAYTVHISVEWWFYSDSILKMALGFGISTCGIGAIFWYYRSGINKLQEYRNALHSSETREEFVLNLFFETISFMQEAMQEAQDVGYRVMLLLILLKGGHWIQEQFLALNPLDKVIDAIVSVTYLVILVVIIIPYLNREPESDKT